MTKRPVSQYDFKAFGAAIKTARTERKENRSDFTQKSSPDFSPSPLVLAIMVFTSFKMSFSLRIYAKGGVLHALFEIDRVQHFNLIAAVL